MDKEVAQHLIEQIQKNASLLLKHGHLSENTYDTIIQALHSSIRKGKEENHEPTIKQIPSLPPRPMKPPITQDRPAVPPRPESQRKDQRMTRSISEESFESDSKGQQPPSKKADHKEDKAPKMAGQLGRTAAHAASGGFGWAVGSQLASKML